jgi:hypothetical protein
MMLSIVFLLMYVASSLRAGTNGYQQQVEYKRLAQHAEDLEEQIKVYNTLKDQTLKQQQSEAEQDVYQKLMGKLSLLQDQAHEEKLALQQKAKENGEKEFALNQYQQLIRNIINANILAKSQIQHRDQLIVSKDATIEEKKAKIEEMEKVVAYNEDQIANIDTQLKEKIQALHTAQRQSHLTKKAMDQKIAALKRDSENRIQALEQKNQGINAELGVVQGSLADAQNKLNETQGQLNATQGQLANTEGQLAQTEGQLQNTQGKLNATQGALNATKGQLNATQGQLAETAGQLANAQGALGNAKAKLGQQGQALAQAGQQIGALKADNARALANVEDLKGDLARTRAIANARRQLAKTIAEQLQKSGLKGNVDGRTGEVTLDFGAEYFDTGSTALKPGMRSTLDRFIPAYAKSLFSDPKVADKIANVEIVGFASATYQGRYVNPKSTEASDKQAIDYNLKLSFGRANSIFKHMLNENNLSKADRDKLLPILKVVGRGYLPDGMSAADLPNNMSGKQFCQQYNCQKAQKVVIKFNMKD